MKNNSSDYNKTALIIALLLTLIALLCLLWILLYKQPFSLENSTSHNITADIYQNGQLIQSISLGTVEESYTFTITGENGCRNEIEVRPGSIGIISADCPDKLCMNQGFINTSLLPITCLPNHLVIQIQTEDSAKENKETPDILTY